MMEKYSKPKPTASASGFTLIEIMMAIGILVIGMTGVIAVYSVAVDAQRRAMDNAGVASLAEDLLSEITADFAARDVDGPKGFGDGTATLTESFIELCCRYKDVTDDGHAGVQAPNTPGFDCEVSIYPLPRRLWTDDVSDMDLPPDVERRIAEIEDPDQRVRLAEEYQFDAWILTFQTDGIPRSPNQREPVRTLLAQAVEYKLVIRVIRGAGERKEIETFRTIILPGSVVDPTP
jgi:prepilin-type N-terminal cleavage/methylation domain-containing protein